MCKILKNYVRFLDVSTTPEKEQPPKTDEIDEKTEIGNTPEAPTVDVNEESSTDKCVDDIAKEESAEENSSDLRASTPEDTSTAVETTDVSDDTTKKPSADEPAKIATSNSDDNLIDVEDSDDYLLHLETILKTIHARFYSYYKEHEKVRIAILNGKLNLTF